MSISEVGQPLAPVKGNCRTMPCKDIQDNYVLPTLWLEFGDGQHKYMDMMVRYQQTFGHALGLVNYEILTYVHFLYTSDETVKKNGQVSKVLPFSKKIQVL